MWPAFSESQCWLVHCPIGAQQSVRATQSSAGCKARIIRRSAAVAYQRSRIRALSAVAGGLLMGTLLENLLCDRQCREHIRPPDVKGQMRDNLRRLRLRQAVVHRPVEMVGNLRDLPGGN